MAEGNNTGLRGLGMGKPAGLDGEGPAQTKGTAGTETTTTQTGDGQTVAAVDRPAPTRVVDQGNKATLRNDPPAIVSGFSSSFVHDHDLRFGEGDELSPAAKLAVSVATQDAASSIALDAEGTQYSSHPVANFRVGRFRFQKGLLRLDSEDAAEFDRIMSKMPAQDQARVRKLDVAAAEKIVRDRLERPGATKQFDSSIGERPDPLGPTFGKVELGFSNRAQQDMNTPIVAEDQVVDPQNKTGLDLGPKTEAAAREAAGESV